MYTRWNLVTILITRYTYLPILSLEAAMLNFPLPVASGWFTGCSIGMAVGIILSRSQVMCGGYFTRHWQRTPDK